MNRPNPEAGVLRDRSPATNRPLRLERHRHCRRLQDHRVIEGKGREGKGSDRESRNRGTWILDRAAEDWELGSGFSRGLRTSGLRWQRWMTATMKLWEGV